jgi:hypothetical protein
MDVSSILNLVPLLSIILPIGILTLVVIILVVVGFTLRKKLVGAGNTVAGTVTPGLFAQIGRAMAAGQPSPLQLEVERIGWIGEARILDRNDLETVAKNRTTVYYRCALVLEVHLPNTAPYRAPCEQWFVGSVSYSIDQGALVPVRVDPRNPQIVFVDLAAREQAKATAELADREAHARRQAELLGQNRS